MRFFPVNFGAPEWLWALLLVPFFAWLFLRSERRGMLRLREFVSPRLFPQLAASVNRFARKIRVLLLLLGAALALVALAQPRWGYTYDETKRKGLDLIFAIDTSRSMLSNDVQPNRLERVKLAAQDLINDLQGDRVGLIAFAGRAFLQAPLTIDYSAAVDAVNDLDTKSIPEGGTNISDAINLAGQTFGKSAVGNRALVIFTDGEELSGDAVQAARNAAEAGVRIFTIGVGTAQGSLIPINGADDGSPFVKDSNGQVVKSKLDEKRLREIAQATGGIYLHLENGPQTMQQLMTGGLAKMQAGEIDARLAREPIERYEWPLGAAIFVIAFSLLINDRKKSRHILPPARAKRKAALAASLAILSAFAARASVPGLDLYQQGKFPEAYQNFQQDLKAHPDSPDRDKMQFDSGAAAYKMGDYSKALESFSQALLTKDRSLQGSSHFNLGRTLEERADLDETNEQTLKDLEDAKGHYEEALKIDPNNAAAKANLEAVKKKIERLKQHPKKKPTPTPPPKPPPKKKNNSNDQGQGGGQGQNQNKDQQKQNGGGQQQDPNQSQSKNGKGSGSQQQQSKSNSSQTPSPSPGQSPSPSPSTSPSPSGGQGPSQNQPQPQPQAGQSPSPNENGQQSPSPRPGQNQNSGQNPAGQIPTPNENGEPSPTPGEGSDSESNGAAPSVTPSSSPQKKFGGEVKGTKGDQDKKNAAQVAQAEQPKDGEMTPEQARRLLESMKNEEQRVLLDERKPVAPVYNDW